MSNDNNNNNHLDKKSSSIKEQKIRNNNNNGQDHQRSKYPNPDGSQKVGHDDHHQQGVQRMMSSGSNNSKTRHIIRKGSSGRAIPHKTDRSNPSISRGSVQEHGEMLNNSHFP